MKHLKRKLMMTLALLLTAVTGAWAQTGENIFQYCYDCQRSPAYPKTTASASLSGFTDPYVGYKGSGSNMGNTSAGPWKLEYVGLWSTTDKHGIEDFRVSNYQYTYNCTDVPVFRLYQWNATANEYQHASYGVVCAYAKVTNAVEHTAFFEAADGWGCVLTNSSHSSSMNITFDEDLTTGLTTLIAAAKPAASGTPVDIDWDAATPNTATLTNGMPAGNVTVSVEYFPQAEFAKSTDATPVALAPTAIADVPATTDGPIVKAGTVANIGSTETAQGTVMYYVSTTEMTDAQLQALTPDKWSADVPTAESLAEGQAYVYYYIKGAEPATIAERTDANTCSDGDILATNVVSVTLGAAPLWNAEFDLTNAPEEDKAGKWSTDIPEDGVVKGTPVKVTYTGSKKILGVKAEKKSAFITLDNTTTAWTAGKYAVPAGGLTYSDAITVSGDVTLVLTDGEILTLNKGISLAEGATLTVEGNGTMNVNGTNESTASTVAGTGMLVLTSGTLNAKGGDGGNASSGYTSGGGNAINGAVTVSGGTLTATGGNGGSDNSVPWYDQDEEGWVGGSGYRGDGAWAISGDVIITAGIVTAKGGNGGSLPNGSDAYAGAGGNAINGNVTLSGGTLTKTDGNSGTKGVDAAGYVGAGRKAVAGTVTNNGGTVN